MAHTQFPCQSSFFYGVFPVQGEDTPELNQLAATLSAQKTKPESDHYILAALWLSNGLFVEQVQASEARFK